MRIHPKYFVANGDEMEPGSFKDRLLLEGNPHQLLEGMIIGAYAIQARFSYVFLRWAYHQAAEAITGAIQEAYNAGYLGKNIAGSDFTLMRRCTLVWAVICAVKKPAC